MTVARRNQNYYRGKFNRPVVQIQKSLLESCVEGPTFWMVSKGNAPDKQPITFTDEDAERIHHPHDDAIVITLLIADYTIRRVLVDNGSSADILYYPAF